LSIEIFYILAGVTLVGIGYVIWQLFRDKSSSDMLVEAIDPEHITDGLIAEAITEVVPPVKGTKDKPKKGLFSFLKFGKIKDKKIKQAETPVDTKMDDDKKMGAPKKSFKNPFGFLKNISLKLKFGKKSKTSPKSNKFPTLADQLNEENGKPSSPESEPLPSPQTPEDIPKTGTAAIKTNSAHESLSQPIPTESDAPPSTSLSSEEEENIGKEIELNAELSELREKYEKLDKIFQEKSEELEKSKKNVDNELKTRKEFNKVKDILEKELKDVKDQSRKVQVELNGTQAETGGYKNRINQLEDKVTKLEKEILEKEKTIDDLTNKAQASPTPEKESGPKEETSQEEPQEQQEESKEKSQAEAKPVPDAFEQPSSPEPAKEEPPTQPEEPPQQEQQVQEEVKEPPQEEPSSMSISEEIERQITDNPDLAGPETSEQLNSPPVEPEIKDTSDKNIQPEPFIDDKMALDLSDSALELDGAGEREDNQEEPKDNAESNKGDEFLSLKPDVLSEPQDATGDSPEEEQPSEPSPEEEPNPQTEDDQNKEENDKNKKKEE